MDDPAPSIRARVRERFPAVLLTVLSIIQALALEVLWSNFTEHPHLWARDLGALVGWLQVVATFQGIALVWLFYTSIVMRIVWVPNTRDSLMPFILGIAEFVLADVLHPEYRSLWFFVIATVFALATWTSSSIFRRGRLEPENRAFYTGFKRESQGSLLPPIVFVGGLALLGVAIGIWGPDGKMALAAMLTVNVFLAIQALIIRHYWWRSLEESEAEDHSTDCE